MSTTLFVTGASGNLGRRVVEILLDAGHTVAAGTRTPEKLADLAGRGADVRRLDFKDPSSVSEALQGVNRLLLISTDAVGARADEQAAVVRSAMTAGVQHIVYTSLVSADVEGMAIREDHIATETVIKNTFSSYTLLRNNLYAELVLGAAAPALATGQLVTARESGAIAWVSREDCARAAAAALSDGSDAARTFDITGPEGLTGDDMAALLSELSGRKVQHLSVPPEALREGLVQQAGLPGPLADMLVAFDVSTSMGLLSEVSNAVVKLTGTPPVSLRDVLEAHRAAWS